MAGVAAGAPEFSPQFLQEVANQVQQAMQQYIPGITVNATFDGKLDITYGGMANMIPGIMADLTNYKYDPMTRTLVYVEGEPMTDEQQIAIVNEFENALGFQVGGRRHRKAHRKSRKVHRKTHRKAHRKSSRRASRKSRRMHRR